MNELEKLMQQHVENYKKAVLEIVNNNTNSLIDNDIIFLIKNSPCKLQLTKRKGHLVAGTPIFLVGWRRKEAMT